MDVNTEKVTVVTSTNTSLKISTIVTNFAYLKSIPGLFKVSQLFLSLLSLVLLSYEGTKQIYSYQIVKMNGLKSGRGFMKPIYLDYSENEFLLISSFAFCLMTFIILLSCLASFMTSCTLSKTAFYFFYHFSACVFLFVGGITTIIQESTFLKRDVVITAGVAGFVASFLYGADFLFAYQKEYGLSPPVVRT